MPCLSLITAALPSRVDYFAETASSVAAARDLVGSPWSLQWIVVVDGPGSVEMPAGVDQLCVLAERRGVAATRNVGLAVATGDWIMPLDADDELEPAGLARMLPELTTTDAGWISTNRILFDGSRTPHWRETATNWRPGQLAEHWTAPFPFHPNSLIARRDHALACGGWPAVPTNEDLGWALLLAEEAMGASLVDVTLRYRVWDGQQVANDHYVRDKAVAFRAIQELINARRVRSDRPPVAAPSPGPAYGRQALVKPDVDDD